jgi:protein-disulfide isomerase-like protein with CxxC motif
MYYTDPACPWSWAAEPCLRRIEAEFGDGVSITYVMGGLALDVRARPERLGSGYLWAAAT